MIESIGKLIRIVILGALFYYIVIDKTEKVKDLTVSVEKAVEIGEDVEYVHNEKQELTELGFLRKSRLIFDRSRIYPVILGMNMFQNFKLKEFDHFAFQHGDYLIQMAYAYLYKKTTIINL